MRFRPDWRQFEKSVAALTRAIDPESTVTESAALLDLETGMPRERDVWIEGSLAELLPFKIVVRCRQHHRKAKERDIDDLSREMVRSGAAHGVLYSLKGFRPRAADMARGKGISCLLLSQNGPLCIPRSFPISRSGSFVPTIDIRVLRKSDACDELVLWNDVFFRPWGDSGSTTDVLGHLIEVLEEQQAAVLRSASSAGMPPSWGVEVLHNDRIDPAKRLTIGVTESWRACPGSLEALLVEGTYTLSVPSPGRSPALPLRPVRLETGGLCFLVTPTRDAVIAAFGSVPLG